MRIRVDGVSSLETSRISKMRGNGPARCRPCTGSQGIKTYFRVAATLRQYSKAQGNGVGHCLGSHSNCISSMRDAATTLHRSWHALLSIPSGPCKETPSKRGRLLAEIPTWHTEDGSEEEYHFWWNRDRRAKQMAARADGCCQEAEIPLHCGLSEEWGLSEEAEAKGQRVYGWATWALARVCCCVGKNLPQCQAT